ncbi:MAG TPA: hypothetical protein VGB55_15280 [Tepidisphaeraceae bacterium]|jgi:hypothetical protein
MLHTRCFAVLITLGLTQFAAAAAPVAGDPYPLSTDAQTNQPLGDKPVIHDHNGRELRFANPESLEQFKKDPKAALTKVDEQIVAQQKPNYPTDKCLVSDEPLGDMGDPIEYVFNNRLVRLCCGGCKKGTAKKSAEVFQTLDAEVIKKQQATYPLKTDVVTGEPLGEKPVDFVIGTTLVRFAKESSIEAFKADPAKYLALVK